MSLGCCGSKFGHKKYLRVLRVNNLNSHVLLTTIFAIESERVHQSFCLGAFPCFPSLTTISDGNILSEVYRVKARSSSEEKVRITMLQ